MNEYFHHVFSENEQVHFENVKVHKLYELCYANYRK